MADSTLNSFLARGTNAQRLAFTPSPPTPASGPSPTYIWHETDTGDTYAHNGSGWDKVNTASAASIGAMGPMGMDGEEGPEGMPIPGPAGPAGAGGSSNSVAIVQTNSFIGDSAATATLTLTGAPTAGNLLVAIGSFWTNAMAVNSNWTTLLRSTPGANSGTFIATRVVVDGDTASLPSPVNNPSSYAMSVFEVSGATPPGLLMTNFGQTSATSYSFHYGSPKANSYLVGAITSEANNTAPSSNSGCTLGTTVTGTTSNASPREITPFTQGTVAAGVGGPATVGFAASVNRYGGSVLLYPA